jgi:hypothetical protein
MRFTTENGSIYTLDRGTMGWSRLKAERSGQIRREFGTLLSWPTVEVGRSAFLNDSTIRDGCVAHVVQTSKVVQVCSTFLDTPVVGQPSLVDVLSKSLPEMIFESKRMCDTVNKPVLFEFAGIKVWIYPGETCARIESRWQNENWAEATEHCM